MYALTHTCAYTNCCHHISASDYYCRQGESYLSSLSAVWSSHTFWPVSPHLCQLEWIDCWGLATQTAAKQLDTLPTLLMFLIGLWQTGMCCMSIQCQQWIRNILCKNAIHYQTTMDSYYKYYVCVFVIHKFHCVLLFAGRPRARGTTRTAWYGGTSGGPDICFYHFFFYILGES